MFLLSLFRQTAKVLMKNPSLWIFGLFLAILGQGGVSEVVLRALSTFSRGRADAGVLDTLIERDFWVVSSFSAADLPGTALKAVGGLVALAGIVLSMAAIPLAVRAFLERRRALPTVLLVREALRHVWKVAGIFILSSAAFILLLAPLALALRAGTAASGGVPLGQWVVVAALSLAQAVVFFVALFGTNAIVLRSRTLSEGIRDGWEVFSAHWMVSVECGAAFFLLNILAAQLTDALIRPILAIAYLLTLFLSGRGYSAAASIVFIVLGVVLVTAVWVFLVSLYAAFQTIFWTALYLTLAEGSASKSRLHLFSALKPDLSRAGSREPRGSSA